MPQTLSMEPLSQMLKSIAYQKRTGVLRIERLGERSAERGEIYFEGGHPLRARAGQETGKAALRKISEWKQITCSFQGMSRPFPASPHASPPGKEQNTEESPLVRLLSASVPQTEKLARSPEPMRDQPRRGAGQPERSNEKNTQSLAARAPEGILSAKSKTPIPPARPNQPLILQGSRLEAYTPAQPARPSRAVQRWTTHLEPEIQTPALPPKPPVTPRLGPLPGEEVLPGRTAIFKARAMVTTTQALQRMERRERVVFILLDGRRTIEDIARLTHQTESDVEHLLMKLTRNGYTYYIRG